MNCLDHQVSPMSPRWLLALIPSLAGLRSVLS